MLVIINASTPIVSKSLCAIARAEGPHARTDSLACARARAAHRVRWHALMHCASSNAQDVLELRDRNCDTIRALQD